MMAFIFPNTVLLPPSCSPSPAWMVQQASANTSIITSTACSSSGDMVRALAAVDESQLPLLNLLRALDDLITAAQRYSVAG